MQTDEALRAIQKDIAEIKTSQKVMESDIAHHIRRTDLAEENMAAIRQELEPVKRHVAMWAGAGKVLVVAVSLLALVAGILKFNKP